MAHNLSQSDLTKSGRPFLQTKIEVWYSNVSEPKIILKLVTHYKSSIITLLQRKDKVLLNLSIINIELKTLGTKLLELLFIVLYFNHEIGTLLHLTSFNKNKSL